MERKREERQRGEKKNDRGETVRAHSDKVLSCESTVAYLHLVRGYTRL